MYALISLFQSFLPSNLSRGSKPMPKSLGSVLSKKRHDEPPLAVAETPTFAPDDKPIVSMRASFQGSTSLTGTFDGMASRPQTAPAPRKESFMLPSQPLPKRKSTYGAKPHLQMCVTMAERLPATRKRVNSSLRMIICFICNDMYLSLVMGDNQDSS